MKKIIVIIIISLAMWEIFAAPKDMPDLKVDFIFKPEWDQENRQSIIIVKISNAGTKNSSATLVELINYNEKYIPQKNSKLFKTQLVKSKYRLKRFIPSLKPKGSIILEFKIKNHWVYDPNCEIEITIDPTKKIQDSNWKNNKIWFKASG